MIDAFLNFKALSKNIMSIQMHLILHLEIQNYSEEEVIFESEQ